MLSPDDHISTSETIERATDAIERLSHSTNRRNTPNERRQSLLQQKHTDPLPQVNGDVAGKLAWRQVIQLREENKRLRCELDALQTQFDQEIAAIHSSHQQEVEQYQSHLRDLMAERNHMQEAQLQLEQHYQELYHSFQDAIEEEAHKMVTEAAHTVKLSPEHTPVLLRDLKKTIELQARQVEDQHVAQTLYLMREAQRKAQQMEQELDQERQRLETERQSMLNLQNSVREQAQLRYDIQKARLQARWTMALTTTVTLIVLMVALLQWLFYSLGLPFLAAFLVPMFICLLVTFIVARAWVTIKHLRASVPHRVKRKDKI